MHPGEEGEVGRQNHCTPATGFAFWKGEAFRSAFEPSSPSFVSLIFPSVPYLHSFSQTDTASVLHETIEYIKFLHDQVRVSLSTLSFRQIDNLFSSPTSHTSNVLQVLSAPYLKKDHQTQQTKVTKLHIDELLLSLFSRSQS